MSSHPAYYQPASSFCSLLPHDVILHVALELATIDILGPPRHLPPLFRVCRYLHDILKANRKALLARIYRRKFDTRAAVRRLGANTITNSALAFQLMKQSTALKRLREGDLDSSNLTADLWTAYIMFMENDGRNYVQLMEYARMDVLIDRFMELRLWANRETNLGWPVDSTPNSLVVWMLWFTMTPERLARLGERRGQYMDLLRPLALVPVMYYPFYAPDVRFELPDEEALPEAGEGVTPFGFFPAYRDPEMVVEEVLHYGRRVSLMPPLIGLGAKMVFVMLAEAVPYDPPSMLPIDRAHADPADGVRPTQADFVEWASVRGVRLYDPGSWDWLERLPAEQRRLENDVSWRKELRSISASWDNDWNRLTGCYDPRHDLPLKGVVYTFGSLSGMFAGRMQIPDLFIYRDVVQATSMPALTQFPLVAEQPVYVRFTEHHCIDPEMPVPPGSDPAGFGDDVQNAYFPQSFHYLRVGNTLRIDLPRTRTTARYETYVEGRPNSHNSATCRMCMFHQEEEEQQLRARIDAFRRASRGELDVDDDMAVDDDEDVRDRGFFPRTRSGSSNSADSNASYYFGDEHNRISTQQFRLEHDREAEALVNELMSDGLPDNYEDYIENECNGIQDIIITGEVLPHHGEAWHHYRFYGRVRKWDGLIVLVRVPTQLPPTLKTIFRGYLIGNKNFVGSWRSYHENPNAIPLEGPFALSRIDESSVAPTANPSPTPPSQPAALTMPISPTATYVLDSATPLCIIHILRGHSLDLQPRSALCIHLIVSCISILAAPHHPSTSILPRSDPTSPCTPTTTRARTRSDHAMGSGQPSSDKTSVHWNLQEASSVAPAVPDVRDARRSSSSEFECTLGARGLVRIYAGKLFDPETLQLLPQRVITVSQDSGLVLDVQPYSAQEADEIDFTDKEAVVDLRDATVLPGFVDAHVHLFLHPYAETSWEDQLTKESLVERTVRATVHARRTLMAGYTTVRDLGTEGAGDADIQLRKCLSGLKPLIPGPRYFCANRAIIASGSYGPKSNLHLHNDGVDGVTGAEFVDGEAECMRAVRKQVGAGADWIKARRLTALPNLPLDYRVRTRMADVATKVSGTAIQTFTDDELRVLVRTARQLGVKTAAHAATWRPELLPENGGVDTLEHGNDFGSDELLDSVKRSRIIWVPTLSVFYTNDATKAPGGLWDRTSSNFRRALARGVTNIACGGDTGPFPHGDNALEMQLMVRLGADWRHVLRWATLGGWRCVRSAAWEGDEGAARLAKVAELQEAPGLVGDNEVPFGVIRRGFAADIVATRGNLEHDFLGAVDKSSIVFVMKSAHIFKRDGKELL
ncbi:hypothetical protein BD414DRAFT_459354 [Trametes punicea]|nr:hypothetical protein BD414DRAFT_459354 [Trametes punicea]